MSKGLLRLINAETIKFNVDHFPRSSVIGWLFPYCIIGTFCACSLFVEFSGDEKSVQSEIAEIFSCK
jgi:hypothetical protein